MRLAAALLAFALAAPLLGGCVAETTTAAYPFPPVPAAPPERVPLPPVSETPLIWQPGHYDWTGTAYVWQPGRYVARAGHGSLWQNGYWQFVNGGYTWVPAHWM